MYLFWREICEEITKLMSGEDKLALNKNWKYFN